MYKARGVGSRTHQEFARVGGFYHSPRVNSSRVPQHRAPKITHASATHLLLSIWALPLHRIPIALNCTVRVEQLTMKLDWQLTTKRVTHRLACVAGARRGKGRDIREKRTRSARAGTLPPSPPPVSISY